MSCNIHPTAIVTSEAQLGEDVEVGPYTIIGPKVKIGDRTRIASHVVLEGDTTLGSDNEIYQFVSVGSKPQDLKFHDEPSTVVIGSKNTLREYVTIQPGTEHGRMTTTVGDSNLFMAHSHVAHDCIVGNSNVFANSVALSGHVTISSNVVLGGLVGIHQFVRVGSFAMLGAGSMVGHDIPPYCIGQGDRCFLRGINVIGLQRAGFTGEQISEIKKVYRLLFVRGGHIRGTSFLSRVPADLAERAHVRVMLDFIAATERGMCSTSKSAKTSDADEA